MKKQQPKKIAKLTLSKETLDRLDPLQLEKVEGRGGYNLDRPVVGIIETDQYSECFC